MDLIDDTLENCCCPQMLLAVEGSTPTWNETFMFAISEDVTELKIKLMDQDTFTADDFVGEVT